MATKLLCIGLVPSKMMIRNFLQERAQKPYEFTVGKGKFIEASDKGIREIIVGEKAKIHCSPE
jgi:FKBP-type peptidyl-prolyl cis-trans isomerase 2